MLMDLINRGKVYRFLLKPVSPGRARLAIEASVKHHLEAPDSAFKVAGKAAAPAAMPTPELKPEPKPEVKPKAKAKPEPKPEPKPEIKAAPEPEPKPKKAKAPKPAKKPAAAAGAAPQQDAPAKIESTSTIVPNPDEALSPVEDGLNEAFGGDDSSFTETMTGIVETVTKSLKPKKKDKETPPPIDTGGSAMGIEAAVGGSGGSLFSDPKILGIGAAALVIVAAAGFWMFSGSDEPTAGPEVVGEQPVADAPPISDEAPVIETEVVVPQVGGLDELIDEAQEAARAGQVYAPVGNNAIELYMAALELAPEDPVATQGLQDSIDQALAMTETALLERRSDDALAALQGVEWADPGNARLPFLNAQLTQIQLRDNVDGARAAIRDSRFEDAQRAIDSARARFPEPFEVAATDVNNGTELP